MNRELYNDDDWAFIESHEKTFEQIDKYVMLIDYLRGQIQDLCEPLGEWVIRRRWINNQQSREKYYCRATKWHAEGFQSDDCNDHAVVCFKSPRDAEFVFPYLTSKPGEHFVHEIVRKDSASKSA